MSRQSQINNLIICRKLFFIVLFIHQRSYRLTTLLIVHANVKPTLSGTHRDTHRHTLSSGDAIRLITLLNSTTRKIHDKWMGSIDQTGCKACWSVIGDLLHLTWKLMVAYDCGVLFRSLFSQVVSIHRRCQSCLRHDYANQGVKTLQISNSFQRWKKFH